VLGYLGSILAYLAAGFNRGRGNLAGRADDVAANAGNASQHALGHAADAFERVTAGLGDTVDRAGRDIAYHAHERAAHIAHALQAGFERVGNGISRSACDVASPVDNGLDGIAGLPRNIIEHIIHTPSLLTTSTLAYTPH